MLNLQHRDLAFFDKALCFVKLRLGGKKYAQYQPFKCMMIHCDILWTMKKKLKNDASNSFCVLALSIHCFKIFVWIACHGDSKSDIWRYTLVHNFCPPLKFQPENEVVGNNEISISKQSSWYPSLGTESFFLNFDPCADIFKLKICSNNPKNCDLKGS